MRAATFLCTGILLIVLQTSVLQQILPVWLGQPDPLFLFIVFMALRMGIVKGAALTFLFGLLMDIVSGLVLGLYPVGYLLLFVAIKVGAGRIPLDEAVYRVPLAMVGYLLVTNGIFYGSIVLSDGNPHAWSFTMLLIQTGMMTALAFPAFYLYDGLDRLCSKQRSVRWPRALQKSNNRFRS